VSGFVVGMLVGLTGVGGGSLMTPILVLLFGVHGKCDRQDQKGDRRTEGAWATTGSAV
jgi:uncharacterized membrane protein YfcA